MIEKDIIEGLKNRDKKVLAYMYTTYREEFLHFGFKYKLNKDELLDIYQDAIIALRNNIVNAQFTGAKSSCKTYLFSIGKYMIYARLKALKKTYAVEDSSEFINEVSTINTDPLTKELTEEQKRLRTAFKALGDKCKHVLTLFYYRGFDLEDIMKTMNYTNKDVVKSQKSRCLKALKSMIFKT
jgi:RNA polymerase sigma factor (sigma-70 family)